MKISYEAEADALYIELHPLADGTAQCKELTEEIVADYGPDGKLAGLEILDETAALGEGADRLVLEVTPVLTAKSA